MGKGQDNSAKRQVLLERMSKRRASGPLVAVALEKQPNESWRVDMRMNDGERMRRRKHGKAACVATSDLMGRKKAGEDDRLLQ
jgi:hypothetical protein